MSKLAGMFFGILMLAQSAWASTPYNRETLLKTRSFDAITPTGEKIFASALAWQREQELGDNPYIYAQPAQCASNVSRVFEMSDISQFSSPLVPEMVSKIEHAGGRVLKLGKSNASIAASLNTIFGGRLPVGILVSGCLNADCSGEAGDGHISIVGDRDEYGRVRLYHNNWYRPDNEGGRWKEHMIPLAWFEAGFKRKWMPTPWLATRKATSDRISDFTVVLPAIDDLDPTNYHVTVTILPQIMRELRAGNAVATDGRGYIKSLSHLEPEENLN